MFGSWTKSRPLPKNGYEKSSVPLPSSFTYGEWARCNYNRCRFPDSRHGVSAPRRTSYLLTGYSPAMTDLSQRLFRRLRCLLAHTVSLTRGISPFHLTDARSLAGSLRHTVTPAQKPYFIVPIIVPTPYKVKSHSTLIACKKRWQKPTLSS